MPERVDDRGVARPVVLVWLQLYVRTAVAGTFERRVGVGDVQHQAHRSRLRVRRFQSELRVLISEVEHAAPDRQLGVPDAAVVHLERFTDHRSAEGVDVPGNGLARVRHGQVWQRGGARGSRRNRSGGLVEFGDGGIGASHDNSLRSIGKRHCGFQARAQAGREPRIGLDRKLVAMQHGQRIVAVVHDFPPSRSG
jgi:hypothetical protein